MNDLFTDIAFRSRALAQAHPLTEVAGKYRESMIATERDTQPLPEFADWAATAFLIGYCVRRVEEADAAEQYNVAFGRFVEDAEQLSPATERVADDLRNGRPAGIELLPTDTIEAVLDAVIASEIQKRVDHWREHVNDKDWSVFEEYVAWWVVHGYALRASERQAIVTQ